MFTFERTTNSQAGFSLIELLVSTAIMLVISGTVTSALLQMTSSQQTIWNRTEMHSGIRSATELLQQEVGQAGRVTLPGPVNLTAGVAAGTNPVSVNSVTGMFVGEQIVVGAGTDQETVALTAVDTGTNTITAVFGVAHAANAPIAVYGGFSSGIVPPTIANGSTGSVMKLLGDINSDGSIVYIEYTCDTAGGNLYRNSMAYNAGAKPALTAADVLLSNIGPNPANFPCFTYESKVVNGVTYIIDVAVTLTVQTQQRDPLTKAFQFETKALLNVAPRNVFNTWELASAGSTNRVQPTPATVTTLLGL